eukprot:7276306-Prymnesium_polylepis.1
MMYCPTLAISRLWSVAGRAAARDAVRDDGDLCECHGPLKRSRKGLCMPSRMSIHAPSFARRLPYASDRNMLLVGKATALFAAGADATVIRTMGRWSSDIYRLYVRACFSQTIAWSRKAGSTVVQDAAQEYDEVDCY